MKSQLNSNITLLATIKDTTTKKNETNTNRKKSRFLFIASQTTLVCRGVWWNKTVPLTESIQRQSDTMSQKGIMHFLCRPTRLTQHNARKGVGRCDTMVQRHNNLKSDLNRLAQSSPSVIFSTSSLLLSFYFLAVSFISKSWEYEDG